MLATLGIGEAQTLPSVSLQLDQVSQRLLEKVPAKAAGQSAVLLADGRWLLTGGGLHRTELALINAGTGAQTVSLATMMQARTGHTTTQLPDGTVLIFGGRGPRGSVLDTAEIYNPATDTISVLGAVGLLPRAGHSATVLADGQVFLVGGIGADGSPLLNGEFFNVQTKRAEGLDVRLDGARVGQLAALLPNKSVLLWRGVDAKGTHLDSGGVYDPGAGIARLSAVDAERAEVLTRSLISEDTPKILSSAPANADSGVAVDGALIVRFSKRMSGASLNAESVTLLGPTGPISIRPVALERGVVLFVTPIQDLLPASHYTLFIQGATDDGGRSLPFTAIGFKTRSLNAAHDSSFDSANTGVTNSASQLGTGAASSVNVGLTEPASRTGAVSASQSPTGIGAMGRGPITAAPMGAQFLQDIVGGTLDAYGIALGNDRNANIPLDDTELWLPGPENRHGDWISKRRQLAKLHTPINEQVYRTLHGDPDVVAVASRATPQTVAGGVMRILKERSFAKIARGVTAVAGQVLRLNGRPLPNVTLSIGNIQTRSNLNGEFLLAGVPSGHQVLVIDGGASNKRTWPEYGRYEYGLDVVRGQTNTLPFAIWLSRLDSANALDVASPTTGVTVLTNPRVPGLELRIPAGTVIRDSKGKIVTRLSMTAIPVDQPPFPLPNLPVPTYFTVQPGGAHLESSDGGPSRGAQLVYPNFSNSSPGTRMTFWDYDATQKGWYPYGQGTVTANGKQVVPDPGVVVYRFTGAMVSSPTNAPTTNPTSGDGKQRCGDPVDCATGLFLNEATDMAIPDVLPIVVGRSYRQKDPVSRAFGIGTNLSYDFFTVGDTWPYTYQDLILPDGGRIRFTRISPGTSYSDAVYQSTSTPGPFFGAIIKYVYGGWQLTRKDGMVYVFGDREGSTNPRAAAVLSIKDRFGNALTLARDYSGILTQVTSPNGHRVNFSYDSGYRITQATDDLGRTTQYAYDIQGRLVMVTDPAGNTEEFTYDSNHNMLSVKDRRGNTMVANVYDANSRVTKQTYADGSTMLFAYTLDTSGTKVIQTDITNQRGVIGRTVFNSDGYPVTLTRALGLPQQQVTTLTRNSGSNLLTSTVDALNRTTQYQYDVLGNLTKLTRADSSILSMAYEPTFNQLASATDANSNTTQINYDNIGNPVQVLDALGHASHVMLDDAGRPASITDAIGNASSITYFGPDMSGVTDALGRRMTRLTDSVGRVTSIFDAQLNKTAIVYDALDRVTNQTDPNGNVLQFTYDGNGNTLTHADANNNVTTYTYDGLNRVITKKDALGKMESWTYDAAGNAVTHADRKGQVTSYAYDAINRLTGVTFNERTEQYVVSPGSLPGSTLPPPLGPTYGTRTLNDGTISNTWDAGNRLTQTVDSLNGTISRTYDLLDRITQESTPQGSVGYNYDPQGRRTTLTASGQPTVSYTYDNANRLTKIQQAAGSINGNVVQAATFGYDDANRRNQLTFPNGIKANYTYDAANQMTNIVYRRSDNTLIGDLSYVYDEAGRRTGAGGSLASATLPSATTATATYDANNRLTAWNGVSQSYDFNGNLLGDGSRTFAWDSRDQLTTIGGTVAASFQYDAFGRRRQKTLSGSSSTYLYDGSNFIQKTVNGTPYNLLTGRVDEVFAQYSAAGKSIPLSDALGSTVAETDTTQATVSSISYDPYGVTTSTGVDTQNRQRYTGREEDGTGLYFYRARYYNPSVGRFVSEDPIGWSSGQPNNYGYVDGNPVSRIDPFGLEWQVVVGASVLGGGNPIFVLPGPFVGGGFNFGFTSSAQFFFQIQAEGAVGVGGFYGFGLQGGVSHSPCPTPSGMSVSRSVQVDVNVGFGGSLGGSFNVGGGTNVGVATGIPGKLGKLGLGYGAAVDVGVVQTVTFATPPLW